jgi:ABC-type sugar transport system substrate-binding protein
MVDSEPFKLALQQGLNAHKIGEDLSGKIEIVIDKRLGELTPQIVKEIVQDIIKEHLGWLVVWGGVAGAALGAVFSIVG